MFCINAGGKNQYSIMIDSKYVKIGFPMLMRRMRNQFLDLDSTIAYDQEEQEDEQDCLGGLTQLFVANDGQQGEENEDDQATVQGDVVQTGYQGVVQDLSQDITQDVAQGSIRAGRHGRRVQPPTYLRKYAV